MACNAPINIQKRLADKCSLNVCYGTSMGTVVVR